jgi:hypothetical protein
MCAYHPKAKVASQKNVTKEVLTFERHLSFESEERAFQ